MTEAKNSIICPVCGKIAPKVKPLPDVIYRCDNCDFISTAENEYNESERIM